MLLLPGPGVVKGMLEDEIHGDDDGDAAGNGGDEETNVVECDIAGVGDLAVDCKESAERKLEEPAGTITYPSHFRVSCCRMPLSRYARGRLACVSKT